MGQFLAGQILFFGFDKTPRGSLPCDGSLVKINDYSQLYQLIGTRYGGDGNTTFGLPKIASPVAGAAYGIVAIGLEPPPQ
jgi:microcystin-dependent protein